MNKMTFIYWEIPNVIEIVFINEERMITFTFIIFKYSTLELKNFNKRSKQ